jgi:hypothetical protein
MNETREKKCVNLKYLLGFKKLSIFSERQRLKPKSSSSFAFLKWDTTQVGCPRHEMEFLRYYFNYSIMNFLYRTYALTSN